MKKTLIILMLSMILLPACASGSDEVTANIEENITTMNENGRKMTFSVDGKEYVFTLGTGVSAESLEAMLPLELEFEDFAGSEKIAYTSDRIDVAGGGYSPKAGDLCMYIPWGNLCLFYHDYRYSDDLVFIARLESGIEEIASIRSDFRARLEMAE